MWRNWQTRPACTRLVETPWEFEPPHPHFFPLCRIFDSFPSPVDAPLGSIQQDGARPSSLVFALKLHGFLDDGELGICEGYPQMIVFAVFRFFAWSWHGLILAKNTSEKQLPTYKIS